MKTSIITIVLLFSFYLGSSQEANGIAITVTIDNVVSNEGKVMVALHTEDTFMKGPGVQNLESEIVDGTVTITFEAVSAGTFAILALHDVNENQRMDYQPNGMPKESFGMSGNEMIMGPPTFNDAKFEVTNENLEFNIRF